MTEIVQSGLSLNMNQLVKDLFLLLHNQTKENYDLV